MRSKSAASTGASAPYTEAAICCRLRAAMKGGELGFVGQETWTDVSIFILQWRPPAPESNPNFLLKIN